MGRAGAVLLWCCGHCYDIAWGFIPTSWFSVWGGLVGLCQGRSRLALHGLRERYSMVVHGQLRSNMERKSVAGCGGWEGKSTDCLVHIELQHTTNIIMWIFWVWIGFIWPSLMPNGGHASLFLAQSLSSLLLVFTHRLPCLRGMSHTVLCSRFWLYSCFPEHDHSSWLDCFQFSFYPEIRYQVPPCQMDSDFWTSTYIFGLSLPIYMHV